MAPGPIPERGADICNTLPNPNSNAPGQSLILSLTCCYCVTELGMETKWSSSPTSSRACLLVWAGSSTVGRSLGSGIHLVSHTQSSRGPDR